jgi:hypothetical protein
VDGLAADPVTAPLMEQVRAVAREHPEVEPVDVPPDCRAPLAPGAAPPVPTATAGLPDGTYRAEITAAEVTSAGVDNGPGWSGTWTLEVEDGTYVVTCRPVDQPGRDCGNSSADGPLEAGELRGAGQTVTFAYDVEMMAALTGCTLPPSPTEDGACYEVPPYTVEWTLEGDVLAFRHIGDGEAYHSLTLEPYRRIA